MQDWSGTPSTRPVRLDVCFTSVEMAEPSKTEDESRVANRHATGNDNDDMTQVQETPVRALDEATRLRNLDAQVRDQDDLERGIGREADRLLFEQSQQRDQQRLEKSQAQKQKLQNQIRKTRDEISRPIGATQRTRLRLDIERMQSQIQDLDNDIVEIEERMRERETTAASADEPAAAASGRLPSESQRDFLIRTGKITPFSKFGLSTHGGILSHTSRCAFRCRGRNGLR